MSQAELAARLGVHPTVLSQFRTGRRAPGGRFVAAVAALVPDVDLRTVFKIKEREIST
jgi:predicted transcriptional regulator